MGDFNRLRIPAIDADSVKVRLSPLPREGGFPPAWIEAALADMQDGWWQVDLGTLPLPDGAYEYEFVVRRGSQWLTVPDPYAEEITRFSGYRGVLHMRGGRRTRPDFSWEGELPPHGLPQNNQLIIYELPMRWVDAGADGTHRQVGLGTFDKAVFETLERAILPLGVNCIELLPVQDSPDTLNWGYGTRFFFAPDYDMGQPFDLKLFIKRCHQRGIRVILDVVMNHARNCPLRDLAAEWFFLARGDEEQDPQGHPRPSWGGDIFRYRERRGGAYHARNLHLSVAEFLIREYHIDGFRLDEFKGIDNYDFVQEFTDLAYHIHRQAFPGRPFLVVAEDSWRRAGVTGPNHRGRRVVDSIWDFDFRDEVRRLVSNTLQTKWGEPSRSQRVRTMISVRHADRFTDLAQRVIYCTSHDVEADHEQRLLTYYLDHLAGDDRRGRNEPGWAGLALQQVHSTLALTLTSTGIPMFLAGEEFADLHDTDRRDWRKKMSDPVDWARMAFSGHRELLARVRQLVHLRRGHSSLQRNEVQFFGFNASGNPGFHPSFDDNDGQRLFAYSRLGGQPIGRPDQVVVVANAGPHDFPKLWIDWPWGYSPRLQEHGGIGQPMPFVDEARAVLALAPFQVRVFST